MRSIFPIKATRSCITYTFRKPAINYFRSATLGTMTAATTTTTETVQESAAPKTKLHGRAFYESIGSPKFIIAPMVDQSEFAWRMLSRSFLSPEEQSNLLAYTPMFHARLFAQEEKYRRAHFQAVKPGTSEVWLDGNPKLDRPLFVQFCANDPDALLAAAKQVAPYCDAVDLNLGCPQGIARKGHYGAFLQEDQDLIFRLINQLHKELPIPVTAKIRLLDTKEASLAYAKNVIAAGASILTVHGRRREQKGHLTGVADWEMLKFIRDSLPAEVVMFANGNVLQPGDLEKCLEATGVDGVMSAEGNLSDPALFAKPPPAGEEGREYWRGKNGDGGWRVDAVMRRYIDLLHKYAYGATPPERKPLFMPGDDAAWLEESPEADDEADQPAKKRRKKDEGGKKEDPSPNLSAVQPHLFHLLRHFVSKHTDVRDMLAGTKKGGIEGYERVLAAVERKVAAGMIEYEKTDGKSFQDELDKLVPIGAVPEEESSLGTIKKCKRPWWVAQPIIRPLPNEALAKGAIKLKKDQVKDNKGAQQQKTQDKTVEEKPTTEAKQLEEEIKSRDDAVSG